jgi:glycerol-1-phosphate dehydrogenase [NAD(P)+]
LAAQDPGGRLAPIGMDAVYIGPDALDEVPGIVTGMSGGGPAVILQDATPMRRGTDDLKSLLARMLEHVAPCRVATIGEMGVPLHADAVTLAEADAALAGAGCVVALGSGTIADIAKDASHRAGGIPLVVVQTAVSVNAFSDDMAVLMRDGVKRTIPSRWPNALVVDRQVIASAPVEMNQSGFGELASMFTAPADWLLASVLEVDGSYHPAAVALVRDSADDYLAVAEGVAAGDPQALLQLARLMTLSGIAMGVARRTAPMSGTEHMVSHMLDMAAAARGTEPGFHGAQVGIAAVLVSLAWDELFAALEPERLRRAGTAPTDAAHARVAEAFGWLDADGAAAAECWQGYGAKTRRLHERRDRIDALATTWDECQREIAALLGNPAELVAALHRAGAPTRFRDLEPAVDEATARWALRNCFLMRDRVTVADIAHLAGLWDDAFIERVLTRADALGAGL